MDFSILEDWYLDSCRKHEVLPSSAVLKWFLQAKIQKSCLQNCSIEVLLDQLNEDDILPLMDLLLAVDYSDIDAIDVFEGAHSNLSAESVMLLLRAVNLKLRRVDISDISLGEGLLWDLCHGGLSCRILNLRATCITKLNMDGSFLQLHTLNLDFCTSITSLHKDCFSKMPNLMRLSLCETRIANLWTATAALSKLPSLLELRFQKCLCCKHTGPCPASIGGKANISGEVLVTKVPHVSSGDSTMEVSSFESYGQMLSLMESSIISETEFESCLQKISMMEISAGVSRQENIPRDIREKLDSCATSRTWDLKNGIGTLKTYVSNHPSPICFEKHYREYMVASLPHLEVLDNLSIASTDREMARTVVSKCYEFLPYNRQHRESVLSLLKKREMGESGNHQPTFFKQTQPQSYGKSQSFYQRSLSAAKIGSAAWPLLQPLNVYSPKYGGAGGKKLRTRQFEYHPSDSGLMVLGTLDGEIVVINHENGKIVGYIPFDGNMDSVLGLCWLKKHPSKLLAGSDNGCLKLFDINHMLPKVVDTCSGTGVVTFDEFQQLTSVHANSTDELFLASGYSRDVALYDINTGSCLQLFTDMHREPINVAKFAHFSPFLFATSSFDHDVKLWDLRQKAQQPCYVTSSSRGNVMVCFSPDDFYLLVSAIDNEVKQLVAADGRLCMNFEIASTGSGHNYTRSYYMNERDYVISGSSDEHVVHVCCAKTGRRLKDVCVEDMESGNPVFVQSLRGDPFRMFHMSVLTASKRLSSKLEIIKVNLLASGDYENNHYRSQHVSSFCSLGG